MACCYKAPPPLWYQQFSQTERVWLISEGFRRNVHRTDALVHFFNAVRVLRDQVEKSFWWRLLPNAAGAAGKPALTQVKAKTLVLRTNSIRCGRSFDLNDVRTNAVCIVPIPVIGWSHPSAQILFGSPSVSPEQNQTDRFRPTRRTWFCRQANMKTEIQVVRCTFVGHPRAVGHGEPPANPPTKGLLVPFLLLGFKRMLFTMPPL